MKEILNFASENYILFIVLTSLLILAIIGYIVNHLRQKDVKINKIEEETKPEQEEQKIENLNN